MGTRRTPHPRKSPAQRKKAVHDGAKRSQRELRALAARLTSVQESNNRLLARELHDEIAQKLAALALNVTALADHPPDSVEMLRTELHQLRDAIGKTAGDIHQVSRQLHPSILDDLGLPAALRAEGAAFSQRSQTECEISDENVPSRIPEDVALCLYRIAQEALRNVGKHAGAEKVFVRLTGRGKTIELSIVDQGDGFDLEKVKTSRGLGLISMEVRARMIGGEFSITSKEGEGTSVLVRVPIKTRKT
jgi:signal transduction histidine kinase